MNAALLGRENQTNEKSRSWPDRMFVRTFQDQRFWTKLNSWFLRLWNCAMPGRVLSTTLHLPEKQALHANSITTRSSSYGISGSISLSFLSSFPTDITACHTYCSSRNKALKILDRKDAPANWTYLTDWLLPPSLCVSFRNILKKNAQMIKMVGVLMNSPGLSNLICHGRGYLVCFFVYSCYTRMNNSRHVLLASLSYLASLTCPLKSNETPSTILKKKKFLTPTDLEKQT